jgi:hypothetical protein
MEKKTKPSASHLEKATAFSGVDATGADLSLDAVCDCFLTTSKRPKFLTEVRRMGNSLPGRPFLMTDEAVMRAWNEVRRVGNNNVSFMQLDVFKHILRYLSAKVVQTKAGDYVVERGLKKFFPILRDKQTGEYVLVTDCVAFAEKSFSGKKKYNRRLLLRVLRELERSGLIELEATNSHALKAEGLLYDHPFFRPAITRMRRFERAHNDKYRPTTVYMTIKVNSHRIMDEMIYGDQSYGIFKGDLRKPRQWTETLIGRRWSSRQIDRIYMPTFDFDQWARADKEDYDQFLKENPEVVTLDPMDPKYRTLMVKELQRARSKLRGHAGVVLYQINFNDTAQTYVDFSSKHAPSVQRGKDSTLDNYKDSVLAADLAEAFLKQINRKDPVNVEEFKTNETLLAGYNSQWVNQQRELLKDAFKSAQRTQCWKDGVKTVQFYLDTRQVRPFFRAFHMAAVVPFLKKGNRIQDGKALVLKQREKSLDVESEDFSDFFESFFGEKREAHCYRDSNCYFTFLPGGVGLNECVFDSLTGKKGYVQHGSASLEMLMVPQSSLSEYIYKPELDYSPEEEKKFKLTLPKLDISHLQRDESLMYITYITRGVKTYSDYSFPGFEGVRLGEKRGRPGNLGDPCAERENAQRPGDFNLNLEILKNFNGFKETPGGRLIAYLNNLTQRDYLMEYTTGLRFKAPELKTPNAQAAGGIAYIKKKLPSWIRKADDGVGCQLTDPATQGATDAYFKGYSSGTLPPLTNRKAPVRIGNWSALEELERFQGTVNALFDGVQQWWDLSQAKPKRPPVLRGSALRQEWNAVLDVLATTTFYISSEYGNSIYCPRASRAHVFFEDTTDDPSQVPVRLHTLYEMGPAAARLLRRLKSRVRCGGLKAWHLHLLAQAQDILRHPEADPDRVASFFKHQLVNGVFVPSNKDSAFVLANMTLTDVARWGMNFIRQLHWFYLCELDAQVSVRIHKKLTPNKCGDMVAVEDLTRIRRSLHVRYDPDALSLRGTCNPRLAHIVPISTMQGHAQHRSYNKFYQGIMHAIFKERGVFLADYYERRRLKGRADKSRHYTDHTQQLRVSHLQGLHRAVWFDGDPVGGFEVGTFSGTDELFSVYLRHISQPSMAELFVSDLELAKAFLPRIHSITRSRERNTRLLQYVLEQLDAVCCDAADADLQSRISGVFHYVREHWVDVPCAGDLRLSMQRVCGGSPVVRKFRNRGRLNLFEKTAKRLFGECPDDRGWAFYFGTKRQKSLLSSFSFA